MWFTTLKKMANMDDYQQHQLIWAFFDRATAERKFCFRDDGENLLIYSSEEPKTESREVFFKKGQKLMFDCRASLTERRYSKAGVTFRPQDFTAEMIRDWFIRKFVGAATIDFVSYKKYPPHVVIGSGRKKMVFDQTLFQGVITITDPQAFEQLIQHGIGGAKAFGFGMMVFPELLK